MINALPDEITHVVIDEIQKLPKLLDVIHRMMNEGTKKYFLLTGSSARKLKKGAANLLAGRAFVKYLYPLTFLELGDDFSLSHHLKYGGLPAVYQFNNDDDVQQYLEAYTLIYLKEEVWAEHLVKDLDPFRNFLEVAAQANGKIINFTKLARLCGVTTKTTQQYFEILRETHLAITLDAYDTSVRKRVAKSPKFYFIDTGIKRVIENTHSLDLVEKTFAFGDAFEHFVIIQIHILNEYFNKKFKLFYLNTKDGVEIDLIIEKPDRSLILIEIKSTNHSREIDLGGFKKLTGEIKNAETFCLSRDQERRKSEHVLFLHWRDFIEHHFLADESLN